MTGDLGASQDTITWVLTSYIVASAIAMPVTGWMADRFGARQLFLTAVAVFIIASMLCGIATSLEEMVAFRLVQGTAGAFISPLGQTVMLDSYPREKHGYAMALYGMGVMIGPILGPVIGGWLTEYYSWRWSFYINLPIGILALVGLWLFMPRKTPSPRRFDFFGFGMIALGVAALQLMLDRGQQEDWFHSVEIWIEAAVAVSAFWIALVHIATGKRPLFEAKMFRDRNLVTGLAFMFLLGMLLLASLALLPPFLQHLFGYPVLQTGMVMAPRGVGVLITMFIVGRIINKVDPRLLVLAGFLLTALSLWQMSQFSLNMDWRPVVVSGIVQGLGLGLIFVPLNTMAFATLPGRYRTEAASLLNLARNIGSSVGISIVTAVLGYNVQVSHADLAAHVTPFTGALVDPALAQSLGRVGDTAIALVNAEVNRQAMMIAYLDDFKLMLVTTLVMIPFIALLRRPRYDQAPPEMVME